MSSDVSNTLKKILNLKSRPWQAAIFIVLVGFAVWIDFKNDRATSVGRGVTSGTCVSVVDGDTIDVRSDDGEEIRIRLLGVDCMETHNEIKMAEQAEEHGRSMEQIRRLGERAKDQVRDFALNLPVEWEVPRGTPLRDPYNRVLAYVEVGGVDLGELLLRKGLAEVRRDKHPRQEHYRSVAQPLMQ